MTLPPLLDFVPDLQSISAIATRARHVLLDFIDALFNRAMCAVDMAYFAVQRITHVIYRGTYKLYDGADLYKSPLWTDIIGRFDELQARAACVDAVYGRLRAHIKHIR